MYVRQTQFHGYVSLALTGLLFVLALFPVHNRFELFEKAVGFVILGTAVFFGVRGIRIERGIGKGVAWLSLGVLFLSVLVVFVLGAISIVRSMAESHR
jgi:hypothetical protein